MANYYVIGNGTTAPTAAQLTALGYSGYTVVTEDKISNPYPISGGIRLNNGDNIVISGSVNSDVSLNPGSTTTGFTLNVEILDNTNTFNVDVTTSAGLNYTEPNITYTVKGDAPKVSIGGDDNTQVQTVNVLAGATIGAITGGSDASDADVVNIAAGGTTGAIDLGGGKDTITATDATINGEIQTGTGDDKVTLTNTTVTGAINTDTGVDTMILAGTTSVGSNGTYSIGMGSDNDNLTIGKDVTTTGNVVGYNGDNILSLDVELGAEKQSLISVLHNEGFYDDDGDGTYTYDFNRDVDKLINEFSWNGVEFDYWDGVKVLCFATGTLIETDRGAVAIETLAEGDLVMTRDNGLQPIRWIGSRALSAADLDAAPHLRPIRIRRHALGTNLPSSDLLVSPQHRVLVRSAIAQKMFGAPEVLVAAKQLCQVEGIDIATDLAAVEYVHMLFDRHEVVISNGAETESLYTGPEALKSVGPAALAEIFAIFPELAERDYTPVAARPLASGRMARKLAVRHAQNAKALVD